ncbi:alpha/beta fold hydrolase [Dokdonella ginsengisoli]|uniref:Alpha/beta fold hydrolase n=1 Tax=Dokdonella ginsengisoli TaxID=363846 RepID=A0ABV9QZ72_9GAMM
MGFVAAAVAILAALLVLLVALVAYTAAVARRAQARVPPLGRFVDVDGARLHYVDRGRGPVVVLLHGLGGNLRNFHALIERLAPDHRVVALDRPGCGYSTTASAAQPDLFEQARIVAAFLRALDLRQPLVVGHSMGGALALALALDFPDHVGSLVLLSPASHEVREPPAPFKGLDVPSPVLRRVLAWTLATPLGQLAHERMLAAVFAPDAVTPGFDVEGGGALGARPGNFIAASADMVALPAALAAMAPRYPSLSLPVQVVFGRDDPICPLALHGLPLAAAVPGAALHLLDGGHMIPLTQADAVAALLRKAAAERREAATVRTPVANVVPA